MRGLRMRALFALALALAVAGCLEPPRAPAPQESNATSPTATTPSPPSSNLTTRPPTPVAPPVPSSPASSQAAQHGQDNEFGSIRTPYAIEVGANATPVTAHVTLRTTYADRDARFFMFAVQPQGAINVSFDHLRRTDTGAELACYQRTATSDGPRCFVDLKEMPPAGTEIQVAASAEATAAGGSTLGFIARAFTSTWASVQMSNGLVAELYGYTQITVRP